MALSIWTDTYFTTTADTLNYHVDCETGTIFQGRAYKFPQGSELKININSICRDYLSNSLPDFRNDEPQLIHHTDACKEFELYNSDDDELLETYKFLFNWDYENAEIDSDSVIGLTQPINGRVDPRMKLFFTSYTDVDDIVAYDFCGDSDTIELEAGVNTYVRTAGEGSYDLWQVGDVVYDKKACGEYALYYQGANGGWNSFLIEGKVVESDAIEAYYYNKSYDNTSIEFERGRYIADIAKNYELHTSFLTDSQAENLAKNLLSSNQVYLHRLADNKIMPVVIENKDITYRKYVNEKRLISYQIDVRCSQTRIRR